MNSAKTWIKKLSLQKHPEGGWYREVYRSSEIVLKAALPERFSGNRCFATSIYYLLENDDFSAFHSIKSDETWHFYSGNTNLLLYVINCLGELESYKLGCNAHDDSHIQFTVPQGCWFAAELQNKDGFALLGCSVAPGFEFLDFTLAQKEHLCQQFPKHTDIIERLTRG